MVQKPHNQGMSSIYSQRDLQKKWLSRAEKEWHLESFMQLPLVHTVLERLKNIRIHTN